jgi:hypothetical protein
VGLAPHAADAIGTNDVNQISNVLDTRHVPHRFLYELLQIKRRQPSSEEERPSAMFNEHVTNPATEVGVMFEMLPSQHTQVESFA